MKVIDKGIGMSNDEIANAFNLYWCSADAFSQNLNPKGNGVGLYICRQICEGLGGSISVLRNNQNDTGCEFSFSMKGYLVPMVQGQNQNRASLSDALGSKSQTLKVVTSDS